MAEIKFLKGLKENLAAVPIIEGQILITLDEKKIYFDKAGTKDAPGTSDARIILGDIDLTDLLNQKQDILEFETAYDAETNKVATMADVTSAVSELAGAMHFVGLSISDPTAEDGPTISGYSTPIAGDVCLYENKEFVFDGTSWKEFGDESIYAVKGSITNEDIAADAAIARSKIYGLEDELAGIKGSDADTAETESLKGLKKYVDAALAWGEF
ncbi:MAG: hypothetical protein NC548_22695 [Lachnospiraceae bacterium]|nr:hypothetical protein [Lachnospiraceae bacterium]